MKYKLKENVKLEREDLVDTCWILNNNITDKQDTLSAISIKFNLASWNSELETQLFESYKQIGSAIDWKIMEFDVYFEEISFQEEIREDSNFLSADEWKEKNDEFTDELPEKFEDDIEYIPSDVIEKGCGKIVLILTETTPNNGTLNVTTECGISDFYCDDCKSKKESSGDFLQRLGTDAQKWAKEFIKIDKEKDISEDEGTMIGWFANALCAGEDHYRWSLPEEGTFTWAVERMKKGKKIRRQNWSIGMHIFITNSHLYYWDGTNFPTTTMDLDATDWEIYEEKSPYEGMSIEELIYQAHMKGQMDYGCTEPGYSNARVDCDKIIKELNKYKELSK